MESYQPIIGLEVHLELKTSSKMFCGCAANHFGKKPNTLCCPVCLGLPGSLPVPNKKAVEWTALLGLALNCQVSKESYFERKNYFYPDLPKGYQISQYHQPLAINGKLKPKTKNQKLKTIRIQRVHLEEDTAKLIHQFGTQSYTLIDFNRAGVPLVEIVTEPDINSSEEAKIYLKKIQQIVRCLGISDADMEKGSMRCEPNVNVKIKDEGKWVATPIVEIKNINSFRFVQKAIDYEIQRQIEEYQKTKITKDVGNKTTRGFEENKGVTYPQRQKEEAFDYRYFPEPDIPPIRWTKSQLSAISYQLSAIELPDKKQERFIKQYGLSEYQAEILTANKETADYFEKAVGKLQSYKATRLQGLIKAIANAIINKKVDVAKLSPKKLARMIVQSFEKKELPVEELKKAIRKVLAANPKAVEDYKKGKIQVIMFLVGQVMKETKRKASASIIKNLIEEKIIKL